MTPRFGVTLRITLVFVAFAAALLAVVGTLSFGSGRDALEGAAVSELLSSALEKEAQIDRLIALQQGRIELIAAAPALAAALAARGAARPAAMARASDELLPHTRLQPSEFIMLAIADPDSGRLLAATSAAAVGAAAVEQPFFLNGKHGYFMQPPHLSRFVNAAAIAVSAPIKAADGALLGVLAGWIDLDGLNRIMLQRSGVHYSDEVFLVNQAAQFVTQPRFLKQPGALRLQARSRAVQLCLAGNSGVLFSDDYRGVPSITIYRWLPRHKLGLITKISQAEASLPVRDFGQALLAMGALILLLGSAIAVWLARTITRPLHTLRRAVAHFGHGERDAGLPSAGADELGELAREFKRMAAAVADKEAQLLSNAAELERRVRERTQELQRQADLLDLAHDAIIVLDAGERVAYWNHGAQEMYGWSREHALGRELAALLDAGAAAPAGIAATLRQHGRWEGRLIHARRDGSRAVVASRQARHVDEHSQSTVTLIINSDITEHSQAEEELNKFFDLSLDLLCIASVDGHFKRLNPAWEKTLGYSTDELSARPYLDFIHPDDRPATGHEARELADGKRTEQFENRYRCKDGSYRNLSWQAVPTASGLVYAVAHDVTERNRAESELRQARDAAEAASRAKSAFLANMSHEIRTPMNGVIGLTALVLKTDLTVQQRDYMQLIKTSAGSLLRLLNDILDFSKMEEGKLELDAIAFELRESLGDTLKAFAATANDKGLELTYQVAPDVPAWFVGDPGRLAQIVINLAGNALKFTRQGEVVVRVACQALSDGVAQLRFCVSDTGIGIAPEQQQNIFRAFAQADSSTTREYGGTGLGLTIVSQLVGLMGGKIWVDSAPGRGTDFHFTLRLALAAEAPPPAQQAGALDNMAVLVVDDNQTNRLILGQTLTNWNMRPTLASDAGQALAALRLASAAGTSFPLALLDARMPDADGFELAEAIRQLPGVDNTVIMMLSSSDAAGEVARCEQLGIQRFLRKPVKQSELFDAIMMAAGIASREAARIAGGVLAMPAGPARVLRVLVAEDHPINQTLVTEILRARGHLFALANNGREALELLEGGAFDAVLMDGQMPEMDGYQATREIRRRERERGGAGRLRIIALTANAMREDRELCLAAGMDDYVSKPIDPDQLLERLEADSGGAAPARAPEPAPQPQRQRGAARFATFDLDAARQRARGKEALLKSMAQAFLQALPASLAALEDAVGALDAAGVERAAHRIKGAAATLSAQALAQAADTLELQARRREPAAMPAALALLAAEAAALAAELVSYCGDGL